MNANGKDGPERDRLSRCDQVWNGTAWLDRDGKDQETTAEEWYWQVRLELAPQAAAWRGRIRSGSAGEARRGRERMGLAGLGAAGEVSRDSEWIVKRRSDEVWQAWHGELGQVTARRGSGLGSSGAD